MKEDRIKKIGLTTGHGHRKGQDHFVKLVSWAGLDENGDWNWTTKFHCVDVDSSGHSAEEAAYAVKVSTEELLSILNEIIEDAKVEIYSITGDSGGGATVHHLHKELIPKGVMDPISKKLACDMHNFVKLLEVACVDTWGMQGIGHHTLFQMIWLFVTLLKKVRKEYRRTGLNEMWARVVTKLQTNRHWQNIAFKKCRQSFEEFMKYLEELEEFSNDGIDVGVKLMTEAPKNVQDPVFSRWGTVLAAIESFVDKWVIIYFLAIATKGDRKSGCYLWKIACALIS